MSNENWKSYVECLISQINIKLLSLNKENEVSMQIGDQTCFKVQ